MCIGAAPKISPLQVKWRSYKTNTSVEMTQSHSLQPSLHLLCCSVENTRDGFHTGTPKGAMCFPLTPLFPVAKGLPHSLFTINGYKMFQVSAKTKRCVENNLLSFEKSLKLCCFKAYKKGLGLGSSVFITSKCNATLFSSDTQYLFH